MEANPAPARARTPRKRSMPRPVQKSPSRITAASELAGIAQGLAAVDKGVLQVVSDFSDPREELGAVLGMAEASGRPLSISLSQVPTRPEGWRSLLDAITAANGRGLTVSAQVAARPVEAVQSASLWQGLPQAEPQVGHRAAHERPQSHAELAVQLAP